MTLHTYKILHQRYISIEVIIGEKQYASHGKISVKLIMLYLLVWLRAISEADCASWIYFWSPNFP
jgi:hypothetical protein